MKRLLSVFAVLALAGCSAAPQPASAADTNAPAQVDSSGGEFTVSWVDLGDGTKVRCVVWRAYYKGGPSCDWDHLRSEEKGEGK